jgi:hypothetical protein
MKTSREFAEGVLNSYLSANANERPNNADCIKDSGISEEQLLHLVEYTINRVYGYPHKTYLVKWKDYNNKPGFVSEEILRDNIDHLEIVQVFSGEVASLIEEFTFDYGQFAESLSKTR